MAWECEKAGPSLTPADLSQIADAGNYYSSATTEGALQEIGVSLVQKDTNLTNAFYAHNIDTTAHADMRFMATNLVANGDFSNGTTGWASSTSITVANNEISFLAASQYGLFRNFINLSASKIYYACAYIKSTSNLIKLELCRTNGQDTIVKNHSGSGNYEFISLEGAMPSSGVSSPYVAVIDYRASGWDTINAKYFTCICLTDLFGSGNEPSVKEMDYMMSYFSNSWFNGTKNLASHSWFTSYMLTKIRQLNTEKTSYGVYSGLAVSSQATPDMTVSVASGIAYLQDGSRYSYSSATTLTVSTADATNPRIDIVYISPAGVISYLAGTASASPAVPATPTGGMKLAEISVAANATTITSSAIADKRKYLWAEAPSTPTFINSWILNTSYSSNVGYYIDNFGDVRAFGVISGGTSGTIAFTLPAGYRPITTRYFTAFSGSNSVGLIAVNSNGNVTISYFTNWISLDSIKFKAGI